MFQQKSDKHKTSSLVQPFHWVSKEKLISSTNQTHAKTSGFSSPQAKRIKHYLLFKGQLFKCSICTVTQKVLLDLHEYLTSRGKQLNPSLTHRLHFHPRTHLRLNLGEKFPLNQRSTLHAFKVQHAIFHYISRGLCLKYTLPMCVYVRCLPRVSSAASLRGNTPGLKRQTKMPLLLADAKNKPHSHR